MSFVPRLDDNGIANNPKWYSDNPFYQSGFGLPNCTCYAWGRFWEESNDDVNSMDNKPTQLPTGDAGVWWPRAVASGYYETGQIPELGAVICFERTGHAGHVAIVEEIDATTQEITCSNSEYQGRYFYVTHISPDSNGRYNWGSYVHQGFIYNPFVIPGPPPTPTEEKKKFPWVLYARKLRNRR